MKRFAAILLSLCLLLQCLSHVAVLGLYELNKSFIARNLCENRARPELKCCGKCYLRKQLRKADDTEKAAANGPVKTVKAEVLACILPGLLQSPAVPPATESDVVQTPVLRQLHDRLLIASVFHPPAPAC